MAEWPSTVEELVAVQEELARAAPASWRPEGGELRVAGCFVCFRRGPSGPGAAGEPGWAGAALLADGRLLDSAVASGEAGAPYAAGLLALREGPLLEAALRALEAEPQLVLVNATGRDHPRRAGLALQLGAALGIPSAGVTHRPLLAEGPWPPDEPGALAPLLVNGEVVGHWVRTRPGARPLCAHAAWRVDPERAAKLVLACTSGRRTPEPLRQARRIAREARAAADRPT